jgi:hypothetical protein
MITFSSGLHLAIIFVMALAMLYILFEVYNVVRLYIAEYKYNQEKPINIDFNKSTDVDEFFNNTYKTW